MIGALTVTGASATNPTGERHLGCTDGGPGERPMATQNDKYTLGRRGLPEVAVASVSEVSPVSSVERSGMRVLGDSAGAGPAIRPARAMPRTAG